MKDIREANVPCWYELGWEDNPSTLVLRIRRECLQTIEKLTPDHPFVQHVQKNFAFTNFENNFDHGFGYDHALVSKSNTDEIIVLHGELPCVRGKLVKCIFCQGSGNDIIQDDGNCKACGGSGKRPDVIWRPLNALSASLALLFSFILNVFDGTTTSKALQLITVECNAQPVRDGFGTGGSVSKKLALWLKHQGKGELVPVTTAMRNAWLTMNGPATQSEIDRNFLRVEDGQLFANCKGDGTYLYPVGGRVVNLRKGYELNSHNTDTAMQQLTFIAGLASLHDFARSNM